MKGGFEEFLGIEVVEKKERQALIKLPFKEEFINPAGFIHGGVISALLDTVMAVAASTLFEGKRFYTMKLIVEFKRKVERETLSASAQITRERNSSFQGAAEIINERGEVVATAEGIFFLGRHDESSTLR